MRIKEVEFVGSFPNYKLCPKRWMPEYAFIGRSNVGKSSLINMLCDRRSLAKTSGTPGKTQLINYFLANKTWHLVDLPGYGYATVSKSKRAKFKIMIESYLSNREQLQCTFVLIDSMVSPQKIDIEFINTFGQLGLPYVIVYTKTDRIKPKQVEENIKKFQDALLEYWEELPQQFISSSAKVVGKEEILEFIGETNKSF